MISFATSISYVKCELALYRIRSMQSEGACILQLLATVNMITSCIVFFVYALGIRSTYYKHTIRSTHKLQHFSMFPEYGHNVVSSNKSLTAVQRKHRTHKSISHVKHQNASSIWPKWIFTRNGVQSRMSWLHKANPTILTQVHR